MCTVLPFTQVNISPNITDINGNMLLSCADTHALVLALSSAKMDRKIPSGAMVVISKADRYDVYAVNKKVQDKSPVKK